LKLFTCTLFCLLLSLNLFAQRDELGLVQVTGIVMTSDSLKGIPYTSIAIKGTSRGTFSNFQGFFTIVAQKGDILQFSCLGYEGQELTVPDTIVGNSMTVVQLMSGDAINLPETIVFPWPDKDHFKIEFLAMDVRDEMKERAEANLAREKLKEISEVMEMDGGENGDFYLRSQAARYYYKGQIPPMNIFNAFAWAQFIKAWKEGKFKRKKKKEFKFD